MWAKLRLLCAAAALLSAAVPGQPGVQGTLRPAGDGEGYGVKLCGREFIRAVIFTCGGSRWKRLSLLAMEPAPAVGECPGAGGTARGCGTGAGLVRPRGENRTGILGGGKLRAPEQTGVQPLPSGSSPWCRRSSVPETDSGVPAPRRAGGGARGAACPCLAGGAEPRARRCGLTSRLAELRQRSSVKYLTGKTFRAILQSQMQ